MPSNKAEYARKYYAANREMLAAKSKAYREANKERLKAERAVREKPRRDELLTQTRVRSKRYREANRDRFRNVQRASHLRRTYGLTPEQWGALFASQGHACACCRTTSPGSRLTWATDHDHATGVVRGILCHDCNHTLGKLGDNAAGVRAAADRYLAYLEHALKGES